MEKRLRETDRLIVQAGLEKGMSGEEVRRRLIATGLSADMAARLAAIHAGEKPE
jgi:hypothetical protein